MTSDYQHRLLLTGNRKTTNGFLIVVFKPELLGVVAQDLNICELKIHPPLTVEDLGAFLGLGRSGVVAPKTSTQASETDADVNGGQIGLFRGSLCRVVAEALVEINDISKPRSFGKSLILTCFKGCAQRKVWRENIVGGN